MILVGQYDSPYVRRVAISLHLLGLPFARNTISVFGDAEEMRRINPVGRIPSLVLDDGEVLIDSAAILDHLDELVGPTRALIPPRGAQRREALRIMATATGTLDKVGAIVYERTLRPRELVYAPWIERCRVQVESGLTALERRAAAAGDQWFLGGEALMQPDITLACALAYFPMRAPDLFPRGAYPQLQRFAARFDKVYAFQATQPSPEEVMPAGLG